MPRRSVRRRLDTELVRRRLLDSRARAAQEIRAGRVLVGGAPATSPARQVSADEAIRCLGPSPRYVSRGGEKLAAALRRFAVEASGLRALDAGASTGGFTDCLLQHGAAEVAAVDVGHGQLAWRLRTDPRVRVLERTNVRTLEPDDLGGPVALAVADLSFISLRTVAAAILRCTTNDATMLLLVKPQFEAGKARVGKGGIIRDPAVRADVLVEVVEGLAGLGLGTVDAMSSPLRGAGGNVEYMIAARNDAACMSSAALRATVLADVEPESR